MPTTEEIKDMMAAFMMHYATERSQPKYSRQMANDIIERYAWIGQRYKTALYQEVVSTFRPTAARPLPDVAAIVEAEKALGDPSVYADHTKALPEPEDYDPKAWEKQGYTLDDARQAEQDRVRRRAAKNDATLYERHWLWCMEHNGARYVAPEKGPFAKQFEAATEEVERAKAEKQDSTMDADEAFERSATVR